MEAWETPYTAGVGCLTENPGFYFEFYLKGLCLVWVGQFGGFSETMLQNVIARGMEERNINVQQHFQGLNESLRMLPPLLPQEG